MRNLLRTSKRYKFIEANKPVRSNKFPADDAKNLGDHTNDNPLQSKRIIKCLIFTNPNQVKQPGTKKMMNMTQATIIISSSSFCGAVYFLSETLR
jgi:hypothetical protein